MSELRLFALDAGREFGERVAEAMGVSLAEHEEREFEDGEHKARPLENVRNCDVYVVQSLYGDDSASVNDRLVRLLFFLGALRDASASRVTAVVPYLCYARKDRKTKSRDPVTTRYVAGLFEAVGIDRVMTLDVHNLAAYQNAFRVPAEHLEAKPLFVEYFARTEGELAVVSPDVGGTKRAEAFRRALQHRLDRDVASAFMEKHRSSGVVSGETLVGEVGGRTVIVIDDLIASGGTLCRTVDACRAQGAARVFLAASHGAFTPAADGKLAAAGFDRLLITDTIPPVRLRTASLLERLDVLPVAPLVGEAIHRLHGGGSLVALLEA